MLSPVLALGCTEVTGGARCGFLVYELVDLFTVLLNDISMRVLIMTCERTMGGAPLTTKSTSLQQLRCNVRHANEGIDTPFRSLNHLRLLTYDVCARLVHGHVLKSLQVLSPAVAQAGCTDFC